MENKENTVTEEKIDNLIDKMEFFKLGKKTTVCLLTLINGFEITGVSACVDEKNYNKNTGENIALENAKGKIWELEGYKLQDTNYNYQNLDKNWNRVDNNG